MSPCCACTAAKGCKVLQLPVAHPRGQEAAPTALKGQPCVRWHQIGMYLLQQLCMSSLLPKHKKGQPEQLARVLNKHFRLPPAALHGSQGESIGCSHSQAAVLAQRSPAVSAALHCSRGAGFGCLFSSAAVFTGLFHAELAALHGGQGWSADCLFGKAAVLTSLFPVVPAALHCGQGLEDHHSRRESYPAHRRPGT